MTRWARFVAIVGALMLLCGRVSAQEIDFDYRAYKFYKEDEPLLVSLEDTVLMELPKAGYVANIASRSEYALQALNYRNMGARDTEGYAIGRHSIDYTTARMLSQLRVRSEVDRGAIGPALYSTKSFDPNSRIYRGQSLRAELFSKGYTAGVAYYSGNKHEYNGVMLKEGWAFRHAVRLAGGDDLYVDGVSANILDLAFGASWSNRRNKLNIFTMLPMSKRGLRRASVEECYSLLGDRLYNPLWGIDNGEVRNSRMATTIRPEVVVVWDYRLSVATTMRLTADLYYAMEGVSSLAWFDAPTPLSDNYHYLPSYFDLPSDKKLVTDAWLANDLQYTQIDWSGMRHTNALQGDGHSRYVVEERRERRANGDIALAFESKLQGVNIDYGLRISGANNHRYKVLDDLLGGEHILDLDYYLVDDATQYNGTKNNLRGGDLVVREGEIFGYDYALRRFKAEMFGRADWESDDMRFALSLNVGSECVWRKGYFEKELYRGAGSYGRSQSVKLNPYAFSFAWSYWLDNMTFGASVLVAEEAHDMDNLFFNPEYNNRVVADVEMAKRQMVKLSYSVLPSTTLRLSALLFASHRADGVEVVRCYDDLSKLYSNGVVRGISWLSYGLDLGAEVGWSAMFSSNFRAVISSHRYSNDANLRLYSNSDNALIANSVVRMDGVHLGSAELAMYGDVTFRHGGWMATASLSWCDGGYLLPSFMPRADRVLNLAVSREERSALIAQRNLPSVTVADLSVSRRMRLKSGASLSAMLSIRNLLGGSWVASGYESNRVRCVANEYHSRIFKAAEMVSYSYPRMVNLSLNLWF